VGCNDNKRRRRSVSQTQQNFIIFVIVLGQHVSILIESSSGPSKKIDPYLAMYFIHSFRIRYPDCAIRTKDTCILYIVLSRM